MRIGVLSSCEGYPWAGSEENWAAFATTAMAAGHEVMLGADHLLAAGDRVQAMRTAGLKVTARRKRRPMRLYLAKERLLPDMRAMLKFQPEALLLNAGSVLDFPQLPYMADFCARFNVPKVLLLTFNSELLSFGNRDAIARFVAGMRGVICVSQHNRDLLDRQVPGSLNRAKVIHNVSRLDLPAPLPFPSLAREINLACVARMDTLWKGHDTLLSVLSHPKWRQRSWRLRLYGKGPDEAYVRCLAQHYSLGSRVEFCGWVDGVEKMWKDNHILVLPSRGEGLPLTVVEAMMCGRPAVLSPVGGNPEVVSPQTGFLADSFLDEGIDRALEEAWGRQAEWETMGRLAHARAREINQTDFGKESLEFFQEVVARPHPSNA